MQSGLLSTALFVTAVTTMLAGGSLADRYGPKRMLGIGLALALAGNAAFALAPSYAWLLAAKALTGFASGAAFLAGVRYVTALYGAARSHFGQGLYGGGYPLGSAIGVWTMAPLALAAGWRGAFWISSLFIAVVLALWSRAAPEVQGGRAVGSIADAVRCANCRWTSLQHAAGFGVSLAAGTWISVYFYREFALSLSLSAALGSLLLGIAVVARPLGGLLVSREHVATKALMRGSQLTILAGVALLAVPERPLGLAFAGALLLGLGVGLPYAAVFNTAAASLPDAPGASQGLTAVGGTLGALLFTPAIGLAVERSGFGLGWGLLGAVALAALLATFVMRGEEEL